MLLAAEDGGAEADPERRVAALSIQPCDAKLRAGSQHRAVHRRHRRRPRRRRGKPIEGALFLAAEQTEHWEIAEQPPEFWNQYKTDFAPGTHVRIHPLLDWTELNIWEYIEAERISRSVDLYFDRGDGCRYRSLGCGPCTQPVVSTAATVAEIIVELRSGKFANIAERSGRAQDAADGGGLETLRRDGYM